MILSNIKNCTGCGACFNICPTNAIKMVEDAEGFLSPQIDTERCINCRICDKTCPVINSVYKNNPNPKCIAAANDKYRNDSSSGGIFSILAEKILEDGGYVCGAAFNDNNEVEHTIINNINELSKLRGSKYIQSVIGDVYKEVKNLLCGNKLVFFTGTPCQVAGLYAYLQKDYDNLLTVDLVCHGVPSIKYYKKYIVEMNLDNDEKVLYTNFRDKRNGWNPSLIITTTTTKRIFSQPANQDSYMNAFLKNVSLRESCFDCPFQKIPRQADITLGDYWGISAYKESLDDKKGTSVILINNIKGEKYINKIKEDCIFFEETPIDSALKYNPCIYKSVDKPVQNKKLFLDLLSKGLPLKRAVDVCANDFCDYVISNFWWSGCNYGAVLTAYALQQYLLELKLTSKLLDTGETRRFDNYNETCFYKFAKEFLNISNEYSYEGLKKLAKNIKGAIVGSDQVFRMDYIIHLHFNQYIQKFLTKNNRKIAISGSFGYEQDEFKKIAKGNKKLFKKMLKGLSSFDYISTREISGKQILNRKFKLNADFILDPVFLVNPNVYDTIVDKSKFVKKDCIVTYVLDENEEYIKACSYLRKKIATELISIDAVKANVLVEDWLSYIKNCKIFITDSFHGVCFALIFNKPFICIKNKNRGESRFNTLINLLGIENNFISSINDIYNCDLRGKIDYNKVNNILSKEIFRCRNRIKDVLLNNYSNNTKSYKNKILTDLKSLFPRLDLQNYVRYLKYKILIRIRPSKKEFYKIKMHKIKERSTWI